MSGSDRDRRARPRSDKRCPESAVGGCEYCRTGSAKPHVRRRARRIGKTIARKEPRE